VVALFMIMIVAVSASFAISLATCNIRGSRCNFKRTDTHGIKKFAIPEKESRRQVFWHGTRSFFFTSSTAFDNTWIAVVVGREFQGTFWLGSISVARALFLCFSAAILLAPG
jgi:hypothetical protein